MPWFVAGFVVGVVIATIEIVSNFTSNSVMMNDHYDSNLILTGC